MILLLIIIIIAIFPSSGCVNTTIWKHTWMLTKRMEKRLGDNYTRMVLVV